MESKSLRKIQFMPQSKYNTITKSKENLYLVEFQPDLNSFPDYSKSILINANTTYIVGDGELPDAGWFRIGFSDSTSWHGRSPQLKIWINGQIFYISYFCAFTMIYLTKGNYFSCNNSGGKTRAEFFPVKTI